MTDRFVPSLVESRQKVLAWDRGQSCQEEVGHSAVDREAHAEVSGVGTVSVQLQEFDHVRLVHWRCSVDRRATRDDFGPILLSVAP